MMRILKWAAFAIGGLVGVIIIAVVILYFLGGSRVGTTYEVQVAAVAVPSGPEAIERGKHLVEAVVLCTGCHGDNLEGDILEEDPMFGTLAAPNLTSGAGGNASTYTDIDYVRAIRHGVKLDGTSVVIMPSQYFNKVGDDDVGAIIAYIKSLPPVDNEVPATKLGPLGRIITLLDSALLPASEIDHTVRREPVPEPDVTAAYGSTWRSSAPPATGTTSPAGRSPARAETRPWHET